MPDFEMKAVKTLAYERPVIEKGYADQSLYVNIETSDIAIKPADAKTKALFTGGRSSMASGQPRQRRD